MANGSIGTPSLLSVRNRPVNIGKFLRYSPQSARQRNVCHRRRDNGRTNRSLQLKQSAWAVVAHRVCIRSAPAVRDQVLDRFSLTLNNRDVEDFKRVVARLLDTMKA